MSLTGGVEAKFEGVPRLRVNMAGWERSTSRRLVVPGLVVDGGGGSATVVRGVWYGGLRSRALGARSGFTVPPWLCQAPRRCVGAPGDVDHGGGGLGHGGGPGSRGAGKQGAPVASRSSRRARGVSRGEAEPTRVAALPLPR